MTHSLTRRQMLSLLGATGAVSLTSIGRASRALAATCVETPEATEGPYWIDEMLNRADITIDPTDGSVRPGVPLTLRLNVLRPDDSCEPAAAVQVDVWHCDAQGLYSDEAANGTVGKKYLRGYQVTDANGAVEFQTIYPGWYEGRTVHIHYRVRQFDGDETVVDHVSQLFFDDTTSDQVFTQSAYTGRGTRSTRNANDNIYFSAGLVTLAQSGSGYVATYDVGVAGLDDTSGSGTDDGTDSGTTDDACDSAATFTAVSCRASALRDAISADVDAGTLQTRLLAVIDGRVTPNVTRAASFASAGNARGARARLRVAGRGLGRLRHVLASRVGRTGADADVRTSLTESIEMLVTLTATLRDSLA